MRRRHAALRRPSESGKQRNPQDIFTPISICSYEDLKSIAVMGGNIKNSTKGSAAALKLMMLTKTNVLFLWYENTQQFYRQVE